MYVTVSCFPPLRIIVNLFLVYFCFSVYNLNFSEEKNNIWFSLKIFIDNERCRNKNKSGVRLRNILFFKLLFRCCLKKFAFEIQILIRGLVG